MRLSAVLKSLTRAVAQIAFWQYAFQRALGGEVIAFIEFGGVL